MHAERYVVSSVIIIPEHYRGVSTETERTNMVATQSTLDAIRLPCMLSGTRNTPLKDYVRRVMVMVEASRARMQASILVNQVMC
jgi:hypothetical protein